VQKDFTGKQCRTIIVCADYFQDCALSGRIFDPYQDGAIPFYGLMQFFVQMEALLDQQPQLASAADAKKATAPAGKLAVLQTGELATFSLRILFRQNASWQGSVSWLEGRREESFRSALELAMLIHSALPAPDEEQRGSF
jgi:hypothetical protein